MNSKFIFDIRKCVACKACRVACNIKNSWNIAARDIYVYNAEATPGLPVISISMACNHCQNAVCLDSCPSGAISKDTVTGAIILESSKCFGCQYCSWNCPFKAPKYDMRGRNMEKCNMCNQSIKENQLPACVNACPTGALSFGRYDSHDLPVWMYKEKLGPAVVLNGQQAGLTEIIPQRPDYKSQKVQNTKHVEWSLISFTLLSAASVTCFISSFLNGKQNEIISLVILMLAGLFSFFHLGKPWLSWRSLINIRKSELSREIAAYLAYMVSCIFAFLLPSEMTIIAGSLTGLILMLTIDRVYTRVDEKSALHSGQVLLAALTAIAFFSHSMLPLLFMAIIRFIFSMNTMRKKETGSYEYLFRFVRLAFIVIAVAGILSGKADIAAASVLFVAGEMIDRFLFYMDFKTPFFMNGINFENQAERL